MLNEKLIKSVLDVRIGTEKIAELISNGADIFEADRNGYTPLAIVFIVMWKNDDYAEHFMNKAVFLINQCVEEDYDDYYEAEQALNRAIISNNSIEAKKLIKAQIDLNIYDEDYLGHTALLHAINEGMTDIAILLIEAGANIEATPCQGLYMYTPLLLATTKGYLDVVNKLIKAGANIEVRNGYKQTFTPLMEATFDGKLDIAEALINAGADVTAENNAPLKIASQKGHSKIANLLIRHGAEFPEDSN